MKTQRPISRLVCAGSLCLALAACGGGGTDSTSPTIPTHAQLFAVVSGGDITDTIDSRPSAPLIVQLRDSLGVARPGVHVHFEAVPDPKRPTEKAIVVASVGTTAYGGATDDLTDATGQARTTVGFGSVAGTVRLAVRAVELSRTDTVSFTVKPGNAVTFRITVGDTIVHPGTSYSLGLSTTDRYRNPVDVPVSFTSDDPGVTISSRGIVNVGNRITYTIIRTTPPHGIESYLYVVPRLPIIGVAMGNYGGGNVGAVETTDTDASGSTQFLQSYWTSMSPSRVAGSDLVAYYEGDAASNATISIVDSKKTPRRLVSPANGFRTAAWARLSPDAQWVYFTGARSTASSLTLWRIRVDGTQLDSLTPYGGGAGNAPAISSDGRYVAIADVAGLRVFDLSSRSSQMIPQACQLPRFSPDDTKLSCVGNSLILILNRDGSVFRKFNPVIAPYTNGADWTPDGTAVLAGGGYEGWYLFNIETGIMVPATRLFGLYQALFVR